jgi:hypothetical protein
MARYFNKTTRCYTDGTIERFFRNCYWKIVPIIANSHGYSQLYVINKRRYHHRIIAACFLGLNIEDLTQTVDHINRNRSDNRVENLRIITAQQQQFNRGAKGYCWNKSHKKWAASIQINHKKIYIGYFETETEAHQAYLIYKTKYHII